jgi:hypothetical protein
MSRTSDPRDYKLDLSRASTDPTANQTPRTAVRGTASNAPLARPFLSVHFTCCGVYQRVYRDPDGKHYRGRCPRCALPVTFAVGAGGTAARSFIVR